MANTFSNNQIVLNEFMADLINQTTFLKTAARDFTKDYKNTPMRKGDTLSYRLPYNWTVGTNLTITPQDVRDRVRTITVDKIFNIAMQFNGLQITFEDVLKDPFKKQYMSKKVVRIANTKELQLATDFYKATYNAVGNPVAALTPSVLGNARSKGLTLGIPFMEDESYAALNVDVSNDLTNQVNNVFNTTINSAALEKGYLGGLKGFDIFETIHLGTHIAGAGAGGSVDANGRKLAGLINGAVSTGSTVNIDGLPNSTLVFKKGDIIEVDGSYSVNINTLAATRYLAQFVVTADVTSNGSGQAVVPVSNSGTDGILTSGQYQNVSAALADNAQVRVYGDHAVSIAYVSEAIYFAQPPLAPLKNGAGVISTMSYSDKYRMALTLTQGSDITNYLDIERLDTLAGWQINPEFAIRVMSQIPTS